MKKLLAGLLGAVVALGCAHAPKKGEPAMSDRQPVYVDSVQAHAAAGSAVELKIEGNLPTPAWELVDVQVEKHAHTLTVTVWGRQVNKGPTIQMLEPFSKTVTIKDLAPGKWTIKVVGHGGTGETVEVEVK